MSPGVAAILLAAGRSRRMGRCKQLLPLGTTTVIGRCLETLRQGGVESIVVIVSEEGQEVADAAGEYCVRVAINRLSDGDMASSIRVGRDLLDADCSGVIIALCDCPLVTAATVASLLDRHALFPEAIIRPSYDASRGHPLLFARSILDELTEGMTLRDILGSNPQRIHDVAVDDPGILIDMDTPEDYRLVCTLLNQG